MIEIENTLIPVIKINSHEQGKVITEDQIYYIDNQEGVIKCIEVGSYGMELFVICDEYNVGELIKIIDAYLNGTENDKK